MKRQLALGALGALGLATLAGVAGGAERTTARAVGQGGPATTFLVQIENLSGVDTLPTSAGPVPNPISPGAWAVYSKANPLFTRGHRADEGTELIAEDGFPMVKARMLQRARGVKASGTFEQAGGPLGPALEPGTSTQFTISGRPGDWFQFEAMFVQSNDYFYALGGDGLPLFDGKNTPVNGDVTGFVRLWDAGTEIDEEPGNGRYQKPNQKPNATDVGPNTREPVDLQNQTGDPYPIPPLTEFIRVTITPQA